MTRVLWRPEPDLKNFRSLTRKIYIYIYIVIYMVVMEGESRMWGCRGQRPT